MGSKKTNLVIVRHGESEWNALGKWTGSTDAHLDQKGYREATLMGKAIADIVFDYAYCSEQIRTLETLETIMTASGQTELSFERAASLNERDYGDYTGMNKWEMQKKIGPAAFDALRRGWNFPIPNGETLKMVFDRAVPFYVSEIVPKLNDGKTVLIVSHGNAIRALVKYIETISDEDIANVEMIFGTALLYSTDQLGQSIHKEIRLISTTPPPS